MNEPILEVNDLTMHYITRAGPVRAVEQVTFSIEKGDSMGLVGESGCGKTSVAATLMRLLPENGHILGGSVILGGKDLLQLNEEQMRAARWENIAMVFQAAMNALDPVYKVGDQILEAMQTHDRVQSQHETRQYIASLFELVGLEPKMLDRYPHEYSGGMRQRAVIAMALSCQPDLIIADEPTTALDVIVQDNLLREMKTLQQQLGMSMIYISHDIAVIAEVSDRIGVMYAGRLVELADAHEIFEHPLHPYTYGLMSAFPSIVGPKRELTTLPGEPPDLIHPPTGCRFHPRCPFATEICVEQVPEFRPLVNDHFVACHHPLETKDEIQAS